MTSTTDKGIVYGYVAGESGWTATMNENLRLLDDYGIDQWALNRATTTALTFGTFGGVTIDTAGNIAVQGATTTALTNNATNYVERTAAGVVSKNTSAFTVGSLPMFIVTTLSSAITAVQDCRTFAAPLGSVSSVYGRLGDVVATTGDYTVSQVTGAAPLASPTFTGTPAAPTAGAGTNTTQVATTAFVTTADALKANIASPTFTGTPAAPTAAPGTNTTQVATTAFVTAAVGAGGVVSSVFGRTGAVVKSSGDYAVADVTGAAPLASPTFTGVPAMPTAAPGTNTTQGATTAFVAAATAAVGHGVQVTFDNGSTALTSGGKVRGRVRFGGTVSKWSIVTLGGAGSCTIGVKSSTYASFPGSLADITGAVDPTVSSSTKAEATSLGIVGAVLAAGDVLEFELKTVSTFTQITVLVEF